MEKYRFCKKHDTWERIPCRTFPSFRHELEFRESTGWPHTERSVVAFQDYTEKEIRGWKAMRTWEAVQYLRPDLIGTPPFPR